MGAPPPFCFLQEDLNLGKLFAETAQQRRQQVAAQVVLAPTERESLRPRYEKHLKNFYCNIMRAALKGKRNIAGR